MANPRLQVDVVANLLKFQKSLDGIGVQVQQFGRKLSAIGSKATIGLSVPLALAGKNAIMMASDINESMNKVDVAFKGSSDLVKAFSKTTLKSFGISQGEALETASLFGDMATSMGLTTSESARMSSQLVGLAGDLASFKNIQVDTARTALSAIFTGETESLKRLGVVMTQANLQNFAYEQGIKKNIKAMTQAEMVQLRFNFVMSRTVNAQGDFANTSEGSANQMRIFTEGMKELTTNLGQILLPLFTELVTKINEVVKGFNEATDSQKFNMVAMGALATAIGPTLLILGKLFTLLGKVKVAISALTKKVVIAKTIIFAKVLAIIGIITAFATAFVYVKKNGEAFKTFFTNMWNGIKAMLLNKLRDMSFSMARFFEKIGLEGLSDKFDNFSKNTQKALEEIPEPEETNFMSLKEFVSALGDDFKELKGRIIESAKEMAGFTEEASKLGTASLGQKTGIRTGADAGTDFFRKVNIPSLVKDVEDQVRQLTDFLAGQAQDSIVLFSESLTDMFTGDINAGNFFSNILGIIADFATEFGKLAIAIGLSAMKLKESLFTNPKAAIAAGVALVIAGKALRNKVNTMGQGMKDGGIVPSGFPNDTYPALLTSGEAVIPKPDRLPAFGNSVRLEGEFRVRGTDLVLSLERANQFIGR
jgi:hypothetical protein